MQKAKQYAVLWLPPLLLIAGFLCRGFLVPIAQWAADHITFCVFHKTTGLYCMGCGGTRSMMALLHGDLPLALHNNPAAPFLLVTVLLFYIEKCAETLGRKIKILPRKRAFWFTLLAILAVWNLIRNFVPAMLPVG